MPLSRIDNHAALALARLVTQFKGSLSHAGLLNAWTRQVQEIEGAFFDLLATLVIDTSTGMHLDRLGAVVGCPRGSLADVPYRAFLRAQVIANRSSGTLEELIGVLKAILRGFEDNTITAREWFPASLALETVDPVGSAPPVAIARMLAIARAAGIRVFFEWEPAANTIRVGTGPALGTGKLAGVKGA